VGVSENQAHFILPILQVHTPADASSLSSGPSQESKESIFLAIEMATSTYPFILASLSFLSIMSIDDEIFSSVLQSYQKFTTVLGLLGLMTHRDAFISSLSRICIPGSITLSVDSSRALKEISALSKPAGNIFMTKLATGSNVLGERNVSCLKTLLNLANALTDVLEDRAWYTILETLQAADALVMSGRMGRRETNMAQLAMESSRTGSRPNSSANHPTHTLPHSSNTAPPPNLENQFVNLISLIKRMFENSKSMSDKSFREFVKATCQLARDNASGGPLTQSTPTSGSMATARLDTSKSMGTNGAISSSGSGSGGDEKSFAVSRLVDISNANITRLVKLPLDVWDIIMSQLTDLAHLPYCTPVIRAQTCLAFGEITALAMRTADLKPSDPSSVTLAVPPASTDETETPPSQTVDPVSISVREIELGILKPLSKLMLVDTSNAVPAGVPTPNLDELDKVLRGPWFPDVQKSGLDSLNKMLQSSGQSLKYGWCLVFEIIRSVILGGKGKNLGASNLSEVASSLQETAPLTLNVKNSGLVRVAFPCLQLICSDFLGMLEPLVLYECIETLGCFGSQSEDLNISLTSIGLLWSVSDHVLTRRQQLEKSGWVTPLKINLDGGEVSPSTDTAPPSKSDPTNSLDRKRARSIIASKQHLEAGFTTRTMDTLWMHLLAHLSQLCSDPRPEVRNSANQTLFRTIGKYLVLFIFFLSMDYLLRKLFCSGMNGKRLTIAAWDECIWNVLFPLLERVKISSERVELMGRLQSAAGGTDSSKTSSANNAPLPIHHSRNTTAKQWDETKVLTLNGVTTSIINFFPVLVELGSGFDRAWSLFHDYIRSWCLGGSAEVAIASLKCLKILVRYPKDFIAADGSPGQIAQNVQSRFVDLCRVSWDIWESIGLGIISAAEENSGRESTSEVRLSSTQQTLLKLLHGPFPQDALTVYVNLFQDIHEVIQPTFGLFELKRLLTVISSLLLYHSIPQPGATASKSKNPLFYF
jgi:hypothetical protein